MTHFALYVELKAKPGQEEDVASFLASARLSSWPRPALSLGSLCVSTRRLCDL